MDVIKKEKVCRGREIKEGFSKCAYNCYAVMMGYKMLVS